MMIEMAATRGDISDSTDNDICFQYDRLHIGAGRGGFGAALYLGKWDRDLERQFERWGIVHLGDHCQWFGWYRYGYNGDLYQHEFLEPE